METINERIFKLNDEGLSVGKIAQKVKVKKAVVLDILGEAENKGAGDIVEKITKATGIKAVVETVAKALDTDCGCAARKETLNKLFPNRKLNDLSTEDYDYLTEWYSAKRSSVNTQQQNMLVDIYNRVFNAKRKVSNCSTCIASVNRELKRIYDGANN
jgi:hypothetical protein